MVGDEARADRPDVAPLLRALRLDREIAFGVGAHRAVVEIGRADAQQRIVDDHHLGMHHGVGDALGLAHLRAQQADAAADAALLQGAQKADAAVAHGVALEPGVGRVRRDHQHLELRPPVHALRQRAGDRESR